MTYSRIETCRFEREENRMCLSVGNQPWCMEAPEDGYCGIVNLEGRKISSFENAEMVFQSGKKALLHWKTGEVILRFEEEP